MAKPDKTGLSRLINAAGYSWQGLQAAWKHEAAFRQEIIMAALLTPFAFIVGETLTQTALLLTTLYSVVIAELANSAIEAVVDRISDEHHPLAGRAKDLGSAMVFVALLGATLTWLLIAIQRFA
ncbi:MAG: diacylglycerol kinase [Desulfuromonas sp.]|nr:diacylglycerol kinase [Desulfuromonas sp.]